MVRQKVYHVRGVLQFAVPYDVDWKIKAYSQKQAVLKTFLDLRKDKNIAKLNKIMVYNETKKLSYV